MALLFDIGIFSVIMPNSSIGVGWTLGWFLANTTTETDSFADPALTVPNSNPVVSDAQGRFPQMWLGAGDYKYVLKDDGGTIKVTVDDYNVSAAPPSFDPALNDFLAGAEPLPIASGGTGQTSAANALAALGGLSTAGGTVTGNIVRSGKGVHLFWETAAMNNGNAFLTSSAASDPTTLPGQIWFKYT